MKKILLILPIIFTINFSTLAEELNELNVQSEYLNTSERDSIKRKQEILRDAKYMNLKEINDKYTNEEIEYLYRVSEDFSSKELNLPSGLKEQRLGD